MTSHRTNLKKERTFLTWTRDTDCCCKTLVKWALRNSNDTAAEAACTRCSRQRPHHDTSANRRETWKGSIWMTDDKAWHKLWHPPPSLRHLIKPIFYTCGTFYGGTNLRHRTGTWRRDRKWCANTNLGRGGLKRVCFVTCRWEVTG